MFAMLTKPAFLMLPGKGVTKRFQPGKIELVEKMILRNKWIIESESGYGLLAEAWECMESAGLVIFDEEEAVA